MWCLYYHILVSADATLRCLVLRIMQTLNFKCVKNMIKFKIHGMMNYKYFLVFSTYTHTQNSIQVYATTLLVIHDQAKQRSMTSRIS